MTQSAPRFIEVDGGRIAYEVSGTGPLIVVSHGLGDNRRSYRHLAPLLIAAGYQVASVDLRGHGESSTGWPSYTRTDTAGDLAALIADLGGPAVVVGQSFSGGSATILAATRPELVSAVVEIGPFTRQGSVSPRALLSDARYRRATLLLGRVAATGSVRAWSRYLEIAYPGSKPADWDGWLASLQRNLREPGRMQAARKMGMAKPSDAQAQLPNVRRPVLVIMGSRDPDWPDPRAEAAAIVEALPDGLGGYRMIDGAGHYPNAEAPQQVADAIVSFLAAQHHA